jgi:hypothetical protein
MGRWIQDADGPAFVVRSSYFERSRVEETVERDGFRMTFRGWTYTLEDYAGRSVTPVSPSKSSVNPCPLLTAATKSGRPCHYS